jgi:hypothetical protein
MSLSQIRRVKFPRSKRVYPRTAGLTGGTNWTTVREVTGYILKIVSSVAFVSGSGLFFLYCLRIRYWPLVLASLPGISIAIVTLSVLFLLMMLAPSVATYFLVNTKAVSELFEKPWRALLSGILVTILQLLFGCAITYTFLFRRPNTAGLVACSASACIIIVILIATGPVSRNMPAILIWLRKLRVYFEKALGPSLQKTRRSREVATLHFGRLCTQLVILLIFNLGGGVLMLFSLMTFLLRETAYQVPSQPSTIAVTDVLPFAAILFPPLLISNLAFVLSVTQNKNTLLDRTLYLLFFGVVYFVGIGIMNELQFPSAFLAWTGIGDLRGCRLVVREEAIPVLRMAGYQVETLPDAISQPNSLPAAKLGDARDVHILLAVGSDYLLESRPSNLKNESKAPPETPAHTVTLPRALVVSVFR